jgi:anaerobic ribonucleoside-triphosphate reductase activating protein
MVKYYNAMVVFEEIPNEITLAINITNCPCHCKGCHSQFLWEDKGTELTAKELNSLLEKNSGITCVCFMGGDREPKYINGYAFYLKHFKKLKVGWYSGRNELSKDISLKNFDFIKLGEYKEDLGGLDKETTNQRFYVIKDDEMEDNTFLFWKKKGGE